MPREGYATLTVKAEVLDRLKQQAESKGLTVTALLEETIGPYGTAHRTKYGTAEHGGLTRAEVAELISLALRELREELKAAMDELQASVKAYVDERLDVEKSS